MPQEINHFSKLVKKDQLSVFLDKINFKINGFGRFSQDKIDSFSNFYSNDYELIYYVEGSASITTYQNEILVMPGDMILLKPYQLYTASCHEGEKLYYYYIHFDLIPEEVNESLFELFETESKLLHLQKENIPNLSHLFSQMLESWRNDSPGLESLGSATLKIILVYMFRTKNFENTKTVDSSLFDETEIFMNAIKYIHNNLDVPIKIETMAKEIGVSTSSIYKIFKVTVKEAPSEYIQKIKLMKAKKLLCYSSNSMEEIARSLGFSDSSHFSRAFSKEFGIPPSKYQKSVKDIETRKDRSANPPIIE